MTTKRKLSRKARAAMAAGGRKGSKAQKRESGRKGWLALVKSISSRTNAIPDPLTKEETEI